MNDALIVSLLSVVPKNRTARLMGWSARLRLPRAMNRALVRWFVARYQVDLSECEGGIDDFASLSEFFVRALKPGVRPVDPDPDVLISPVDARVHTFGRIDGGRFVQADGQSCAVAELLGGGPAVDAAAVDAAAVDAAAVDAAAVDAAAFDAAAWDGGGFAVLYLSPKDYHRVHSPREGSLLAWRYLPGRLWPVFPAATRRVEGLFARNERLVFVYDTDLGRVAEALIGAFGVGRMTSPLAPVTTNTGGPRTEAVLDPPLAVERAQEVGRFELGSTVILLTEPGRVEWLLAPGQPVALGRPIARRA